MKRIISMALTLYFIATMCMLPMTAHAESYLYINSYKNGGAVNDREDANMNSKAIAKLSHRTQVIVHSYNSQKSWAYIEAENPNGDPDSPIIGWVSAEFLSKRDPGAWRGNNQPTPTDDASTT